MYIIDCLEEIERQQILNKYHTIKQEYFIKQYDKAKEITNNVNYSSHYKKIKVHQIYNKMMNYFKLVNQKFIYKYGIENIY